MLLDDKLTEIARTLGKVDDQGNIAEDLRSQILGQLSEKLNYDRLYQEAISDPELKRTAVELEAALANAREAREVVFDLFQDLDSFSLDDYEPFSDISTGLERLVQFLATALQTKNQSLVKIDDQTYDVMTAEGTSVCRFTLDRDTATSDVKVELLGLDHPLVQEELGRWRSIPPEELGAALSDPNQGPVLVSNWLIETSTRNGEKRSFVQSIAVDANGTRLPIVEKQFSKIIKLPIAKEIMGPEERVSLFNQTVEPTLQREIKHNGAADGDGSYTAELIGYVELI